MNMISTGAFQTEMNASNRQPTLAEKFAAVWEKKNAKAARAGGVSLMALSLAACGSDDSTTTTSTDTTTTTTVTPTAGATMDLTPLDDIASGSMALNGSIANSFRFSSGNETVNAITATMQANDTLLDTSGTDADVMNITVTGDMNKMTAVDIETVNVTFASGAAAAARLSNFSGTDTVNISGSVAGTLEDAGAATIAVNDYGRTLTVDVDGLAGTAAAGNAESMSLSVSGGTFGTTAATQTTLALTVQGAVNATDGVLETLNIESTGSAANVFALSTDADMSLSTINVTGAQDATVRVAEADVTGNTIAATATGAVRLSLDADSNGATPLNAANWSGLDGIEIRDSATASATDAVRINSAADGTQLVIKNSVGTTELSIQGASYTGLKEAVTLELNGSSTTAGVTVGQFGSASNGQNIKALNLESLGLASSTATTAANNVTTLIGDYSTITVTGDTSVAIGTVDIDPVQTASSTSARAVTIDASAMTGNAFAQFTASDDAKVSYTMIGTANADLLVANESGSTLTGGAGADVLTGGDGVDTIDGGAGADHIDVSFGADVVTGGAGADTYDIDSSTAAAVAQITTTADVDAGKTGATADALSVTIDGATYTQAVLTATDTGDDIAADFIASFGDAILGAHGVSMTATTVANTSGLLVFTGKADGTSFTVDATYVDDTTSVAIAETATRAGSAAKDVATEISDFAAGDILDIAGLVTSTGAYHEGASTGEADGDSIFVLTDVAYADAASAEDAIDVDTTNDDGVFVFLNSSLGYAQVAYDSDTDGQAEVTDTEVIVNLTGITNLTDLAAAFTADSFVI